MSNRAAPAASEMVYVNVVARSLKGGMYAATLDMSRPTAAREEYNRLCQVNREYGIFSRGIEATFATGEPCRLVIEGRGLYADRIG